MALIKCKECGKEVSDKADRCPNCGCPVSYSVGERTNDNKLEECSYDTVAENDGFIIEINGNREDLTKLWIQCDGKVDCIDKLRKKHHLSLKESKEYVDEFMRKTNTEDKKSVKKKDATLSIWAAILGLFSFTTYLGGLIGLIDLVKNRKDGKRHLGSYFAIIMCILWIIVGGSDSGSSTHKSNNKQLNILLAEDENVSVYLDHIENGKIYIKYENHSDTNINIQYSDLTINGTRYYKGIFVDEVYSQDDLVKKLSLYDKEGKTTNYNYESGTIKGKFEYFKGGIGFTTELEFDEIEF
jgi:hypothetical protein